MRLLLANPNTTDSLTDRMAATARNALPAGATLHAVTASRGFPYISNRSEAQVAGAVTLEMLAAETPGPDVAIVAAFGDPGVRAARDLFPFPVVGVAEAAMHSAAMLGDRFGIVAFTPRMRSWYFDCVQDVGLERRFAGFRAPPETTVGPESAAEDLREALLSCISACRDRDGADVTIVAGAPLAGFAAEARSEVGMPLIDPVVAAVHQAVALARLAVPEIETRRTWRDPKPSTGLVPALAARFHGEPPTPPLALVEGRGRKPRSEP